MFLKSAIVLFAVVSASACSSSTLTNEPTTVQSSPRPTYLEWEQAPLLKELGGVLLRVRSMYGQKAMTYNEVVSEISMVAEGLSLLTHPFNEYCESAIRELELEVNQLRVALVNRIQSDIDKTWKVTDFSRYVTVSSICKVF